MSLLQSVKDAFLPEHSPIMMPELPIWVLVIGSSLFFTFLYRLCHPFMMRFFRDSYGNLKREDQVEWNSRAVSNVHALIAVVGSLYVLFWSESADEYIDEIDVNYGCTMGAYCLTLSMGYFIYDTILVLLHYKQLGGTGVMFHHISAIIAVGINNVYRKFMLFPLIFAVTEITTPFVNQRYFLDKADMKSRKRYTVNGLLMWLGFVVVRCSMIPISIYILYVQSEAMVKGMPLFVRIAVYAQIVNLSTLNSYWTYKITQGLIKALKSASKKRE
jgi:hypothetical protein